MKEKTTQGVATFGYNSIVLNAADQELLRLTPDGFYVRGVKLEQDEKEARQVFNAMRDWLRFTGRLE